MKYICTTLLSLLLTGLSYGQSKYVIKGHIETLEKNAVIFLLYNQGSTAIRDSIVAVNKEFTFSGSTEEPVPAKLVVGLAGRTSLEQRREVEQEFYLEKGTTKVSGMTMKSAEIVGGKTQREYNLLISQLAPIEQQRAEWIKQMQVASDKKSPGRNRP
jgi:hypothetical protein